MTLNDPSRRRWVGALAAGALLPATRVGAAPARAARPRLPTELAARLAASGLPLESFGLSVVPVEGGAPWVSWQADKPFILASTAKVITSLCALSVLGPGYRWETRAHLGGPLHRGALLGDLRIVGGGDPSLDSQSVAQWFRRLRGQGLDRIVGDMVLDHSRFSLSEADLASTPEPSPERPHHARPDALLLDEGVVRSAAASPGPGGAAYRRVTWQATSPGAAGCGPLSARSALLACPAAAPEPSPAELACRTLGALWRVQGGGLRGRVSSLSPSAAPVVSTPWMVHASPTLAVLIQEMNKRSNNLIARHLMLSLSADFPQVPATVPAARQRMLAWLEQQGVAPGRIGVDSGSGLSRLERAAPSALVHLLQRAHHGPYARLFRDSLPVAGLDGTLEHRLRGGAAVGRAWLKTGTLLDTRALAGYVQTRGGTTLAVTLLANHETLAPQATPALDACIEWLAASRA
ncbi:D-alanyl-D-alanine carboxypeptidase/D-alanyl-D-alanine-endopeptidase (penicillin-binding protein 4) [Sphaerotilus hippei]|uniref:D-alanyl-D-alanine carboxypeptidase/D-alanyl-D-alanine-endopeptidase (Penicillin-binding protein 4) n=1 Tax=Sphaerotilus hippei TaxID=744406 RepID=A0A318GYR3_9BURK|nr:D-alanyl-D-alanine carboxypeptidase [Sphaerotilus hippei]PXW95272.1 D-alanyl-D-alanine carboxypeptidase/D-alanyl-D-alanine-endopeptidase (penicillin-binding protein 4) [Sphaerotilus hippei]